MNKVLICLVVILAVYFLLRYMDEDTKNVFPFILQEEQPVCPRPGQGCGKDFCYCKGSAFGGECCDGYKCNESIGQCFSGDSAFNCRLKCAGDSICLSQCP